MGIFSKILCKNGHFFPSFQSKNIFLPFGDKALLEKKFVDQKVDWRMGGWFMVEVGRGRGSLGVAYTCHALHHLRRVGKHAIGGTRKKHTKIVPESGPLERGWRVCGKAAMGFTEVARLGRFQVRVTLESPFAT